MTHPALQGTPLALAHRGFTPPAPGRGPHAWENTLDGFEAAVALGVRHLETDCQLTADGVAVLLHDADLLRTTGVAAPVGSMLWEEVARAVGADGHRVPRLDAVLAQLDGTVLNIDCKDPRAVGPLADCVVAAGAEDRVLVASFDGRRSAAVQRRAPGVARSLGMAGTAAARLSAALAGAAPRPARAMLHRVAAGADALQIPERHGRLRVLTPRLLELAHDVGLQVHVWTVDEPDDMHRLLDLGVDGLISDRVDLLVEVLRDRAG